FLPANAAARFEFGTGMTAPELLPLTDETVDQIHLLASWHDNYLDWEVPSDPSLWHQAECDSFNAAVRQIFDTVVRELGADFEVANVQHVLVEDPDLDVYLEDPENFKRS
ncbi:MAG: hypothetical protein ABI700_11050, partial [Chloroflexota bacterium]